MAGVHGWRCTDTAADAWCAFMSGGGACQSRAKDRNTQSVGELLAGFFKYYATEFDHHASVVSIVSGHSVLSKTKVWIRYVHANSHARREVNEGAASSRLREHVWLTCASYARTAGARYGVPASKIHSSRSGI